MELTDTYRYRITREFGGDMGYEARSDSDPAADSIRSIVTELVGARQLRRIASSLSSRSVPGILLKGVAFWTWLYDLGERVVSDIDILVRPNDWTAAGDALRSCGFLAESEMRMRAKHPGHYNELYLPTAHPAIPVELHRDLTNVGWFASSVVRMFDRAEPTPGGYFLRLCPEDNLLHLAVHRSAHNYGYDTDARNILDCSRLVSRSHIDWGVLAKRSKRWGCTTPLWFLLDSARRRYQAEVPEDLLESLQPTGLRQWLTRGMLRIEDGIWVTRYPHLPGRLRRACLAPINMDRTSQWFLYANRLAFTRLFGAAERVLKVRPR